MMTRHPQVICTSLSGEEIEIDERIAPFVQRLWDAGVKTWMSCQYDGLHSKLYPAYINADGTCAAERMAEILKLERWQWRNYRGVLWLHKDVIGGEHQ